MLDLLIGFTGMLLILIAFFLNQTGKWDKEDLVYDFVNFAGALLLVLYAIILSSIPFLLLNLVWAVVSLNDVIKDIKRKIVE